MKTRRHRAIEKAKLPNERVQLVDNLDCDKHEGYTVNMDIAVEEKDVNISSPYTTPTPPPGFDLNKIMEDDLPEENNENLFAEIPNEVNEKQANSALVKVKDFFKGIFKR